MSKTKVTLLTVFGQADGRRLLLRSDRPDTADRYIIEELRGHAGLGEPQWHLLDLRDMDDNMWDELYSQLCE